MASPVGTSSGDRLGPWVLEALLASGGGGSVWRARHAERGEVVALKIPNTEAGRTAADARAFLDEARLSVRVSHRNVVKLLELGQHDGTLYLAMELLSGATLAALGRGRPAAPAELVVALGAQLLDGLAAAHQAGVVHRDVKPSNVFVTTDGVVKLIDFGIAYAPDTERTRTRTGVFRGSLRYCAPEQVSGGVIGPRTDLFSTAVVLAELATGRVLFDQANDAAILGAVLFGPAPPLDGCPPPLAAVLRTALEKDPERRFADAPAMKAALLAASGGPAWDEERLGRWVELERATAPAAGLRSGPQATATLDPPRPERPVGPPETTTDREQPAPSRRRLVLLAVGALPVLLAIGGVLMWGRDAAAPERPGVVERPALPKPELPDAAVAQVAPEEAPDAGASEPSGEPPAPSLPTPKPRPKPVVAAPRPRGSGWLTLECRPGWAEVFLKGERLGITPLVQTSLPQGTHEVELVRKDGARKKVKVVVRADQTTKVVVPWTAE